MRSDVLKEMSHFRLPSSGRRRQLLKAPNKCLGNFKAERKEESYLVRCISAVSFNEPHVTSSYCASPISKVLGLIAAINPTRTAGIPGVRKTKP